MADMRLSRDEQEAFLDEPHYAVIAVPQDGKAPGLTPSWYRYDRERGIVFICATDSAKAKHLRVGSPVSLNVQDTSVRFGPAYVTVEGDVVSIDLDEGLAELGRLADRYYGSDAHLYMAGVPADMAVLVVRVQPKRWLSRDYKKAMGAT